MKTLTILIGLTLTFLFIQSTFGQNENFYSVWVTRTYSTNISACDNNLLTLICQNLLDNF
jgi:hypothetical protein